jgi:predicted nucleic acid-binding protein
MIVESFLDTNLLVYAAAGRGPEEHKRRRAVELISRENFGISAQVLQEFYVTVTRKIAVPLSPGDALEWIEQLEAFPCLPVDSSLVKLAAEASVRWQISYWDGAILAAAEAMGATRLYSEDLSHGRSYGSIRVCNPFLVE